MKKLLHLFNYLLFLVLVGLFRFIPLAILYKISDSLAWLLRNVLKYRRQVVQKNIQSALKHLSPEEQILVQKKFYLGLADNILESIKGYTCSLQLLKKRYKVLNPEALGPDFEAGKSVLLAGSHFNNWEWGIQVFDTWFNHKVCGIYQIVSNPYIHQFLMKKRSRYGMVLVSARNAIKNIQQIEELKAVMILNDQSPSNMERAIWHHFLGINTPFVHGLEAIAKKTNWTVYYYDVIRISRGFYEVKLHLICQDPAEKSDGSITAAYAELLEQTILEAPENWLWSHKRWKRIGL